MSQQGFGTEAFDGPIAHLTMDDIVDMATGLELAAPLKLHLDNCPQCQGDIAEIQGMVKLTRATPSIAVERPPARVWESVLAGLDDIEEPVPAADDVASKTTQPRARQWRSMVAGITVGVLLGIGGALGYQALIESPGTPSEVPPPISKATLVTLKDRRALGTAELVQAGDQYTLRVHTTPLDAKDGYLEV